MPQDSHQRLQWLQPQGARRTVLDAIPLCAGSYRDRRLDENLPRIVR